MSIVRQNLMTKEGYTPYCGKDGKCYGRWPRTIFNGSQFECKSCGWTSSFDDEFIAEYKKKWNINEKYSMVWQARGHNKFSKKLY